MSSIDVTDDTVTEIGAAKVLFIVSEATYWVMKDGTRYAMCYRADEFANPYKILTDARHEVVVATPNSVTPNVDMMSLCPEMAGGINGALKLEAIIRSRCTASRLSRDTPGAQPGSPRVRRTVGPRIVNASDKPAAGRERGARRRL